MARKILGTMAIVAMAMGGTVAMADQASANVATSKPCRTDSQYWKGAQPGVDAMARMSKPIPAGYKPALVGRVTRWTAISGTACDAALRAIYVANH